MESNALLASELAWLNALLRRFPGKDPADLGEVTAASSLIIGKQPPATALPVWVMGLLRQRNIGVDDRVRLMLTLRRERERLIEGDMPSSAIDPELKFINGFLRRLSRIDWDALGAVRAPYDPLRHFGSFRRTEAETLLAVELAGNVGTYAQTLEVWCAGSTVNITYLATSDESPPSRTYDIQLLRMHPCTITWDHNDAQAMLFEGTITNEPAGNDGGDQAFGFLFPQGNACFVDSDPDSVYTEALIKRALKALEQE